MALNLSTLEFIIYLLGLSSIWLAATIVYRLYLHPLAHVPGPKLAAITNLYGLYFSVVGGSRFYIQIQKLHEEYGPIIRITPSEIHLGDPENYEKIYHVGTKYWKSPEFYGVFETGTSAFGTFSNELHRVRRAALSPLFSRKMVLSLEDIVQSKVQKLCDKAARMLNANQPVNLHNGFRAVSIDVLTDYAFDNCYNLLDQPGFGEEFFAMIRGLFGTFWFFLQWPILQKVSMNTPMWLAKILSKPVGMFLQMQEECRQQVVAIKAAVDSYSKPPTRVTIFHQLLDPNATEGHVVPSVDDLKYEAFSLVAGTSDTTGNALTIAAYHILSNDAIYRMLKTELNRTFPGDSPTLDFATLEKLPYLTAVIKEGLRLSYGAIGRLPRVTPHPGAVFNGYTIPPGSVVSMSAWMMHRNENVFENAEKFDPERWLHPESAKRLERYLVAFSRGSRGCLGMNLAYCELFVTLATFFRRFEHLEIYRTRLEDLVYDDYFSPFHPITARKLHVVSKVA
ncbi:MAG: hypothetical protein M1813_002114 [Trichoglossum hirsutum]|nr:MAG: hypothetical protein M1813_002114 [Trichoglossum hirsutum]